MTGGIFAFILIYMDTMTQRQADRRQGTDANRLNDRREVVRRLEDLQGQIRDAHPTRAQRIERMSADYRQRIGTCGAIYPGYVGGACTLATHIEGRHTDERTGISWPAHTS